MEDKEIIKANERIAEFMKYPLTEPYFHILINGQVIMTGIDHMKFHTSWDWLMSVVEKIEKLGYKVSIEHTECNISGFKYSREYFSNISKIHAVFNSVIEFIKWYNETKK